MLRLSSWTGLMAVVFVGAAVAVALPDDGAPAGTPSARPTAARPDVVAAAPGSVSASITGPSSITIPRNAAPERFDYTVTLTYQGPPIVEPVQTRWTVRTPQYVFNPGTDGVQGTSLTARSPSQASPLRSSRA